MPVISDAGPQPAGFHDHEWRAAGSMGLGICALCRTSSAAASPNVDEPLSRGGLNVGSCSTTPSCASCSAAQVDSPSTGGTEQSDGQGDCHPTGPSQQRGHVRGAVPLLRSTGRCRGERGRDGRRDRRGVGRHCACRWGSHEASRRRRSWHWRLGTTPTMLWNTNRVGDVGYPPRRSPQRWPGRRPSRSPRTPARHRLPAGAAGEAARNDSSPPVGSLKESRRSPPPGRRGAARPNTDTLRPPVSALSSALTGETRSYGDANKRSRPGIIVQTVESHPATRRSSAWLTDTARSTCHNPRAQQGRPRGNCSHGPLQ